MELAQKKLIVNQLNNWLEEGNPERSQAYLADQTGVNRSYISNVKNGQFVIKQNGRKDTEISNEIFYKIADGIGLSLVTDLHFDTESYIRGYRACQYAQQMARRVLMDGASGSGKTYLLEKYARENEKVLYVKCTSRMKGKDLINTIIELLNIKTTTRSDTGKLKEIASKVAKRGFLIIIDEAESVSKDIYRVIKDLEDATYRICGMILCGMGLTEELESGARRKAKLFPQLRRRFRANKLSLSNISTGVAKDRAVKVACKHYGIEDKTGIAYIKENVYDMAMLNEWLTDIVDLLIKKGKQANRANIQALMTL